MLIINLIKSFFLHVGDNENDYINEGNTENNMNVLEKYPFSPQIAMDIQKEEKIPEEQNYDFQFFQSEVNPQNEIIMKKSENLTNEPNKKKQKRGGYKKALKKIKKTQYESNSKFLFQKKSLYIFEVAIF